MSEATSSYSVEERIVQGETVWVAIRARGAEWSWLTPAEAARLGQQWVEKYGGSTGEEVAAGGRRPLGAGPVWLRGESLSKP
jgi:hypothetical protein